MAPICEHERSRSHSRAVFERGSPAENTPRRMRPHVLTLTPFYPSASDDAAGCFISEPLRWLDRCGINNDVVAVRPLYRQRAWVNARVYPARWMHYPALPRGLGLASSGHVLFARIRNHVRRLHTREPLSVIHAHGALPCGHAALLLARDLGIRFVVSVHGRDAFSSHQVPGLLGSWCARVSAEVYRAARRVICVSERVREDVLMGAKCSASVVYNAVDTEMFCPGPNHDGPPIVLSIGNLIPIKGHETLLHAIASISGAHPTLICRIIGTGPEHRRLAKLANELGLAGRIEFLGRQSRQSVANALRRCTVFALPSAYEGLGCVYLEAMASAKPTIGCRGQGIAEIIESGENGWLVDPNSPQELASALAAILSDADLSARLGAAARRTVADRFTLAEHAEQCTRIYQECAS